MTFTKAFLHFGASLKNPRWSYSAIASDGCIVVSFWKHMLQATSDSNFIYKVDFLAWTANRLGRELLLYHIKTAFEKRSVVRLVVAETKNRLPQVAGRDCSKLEKVFRAQDDLVGKVVEFDSKHFAIRFKPVF